MDENLNDPLDPSKFATDDVPDGEAPPPPEDPEALAFLKSRGWPSND